MNKLIIITGTPGVGKSTLAVKLAKKLKYRRIDLHDYYTQISEGYDRKKQCYNINLKKLEEIMVKLKKTNNLILDSHIAHLLPKKWVDLCIVLICTDLKRLEKRLRKRKYSNSKIIENLQAEIFQVCLSEAQKKKHKIVVFNCNHNIDLNKVTKSL